VTTTRATGLLQFNATNDLLESLAFTN